MRRLGARRRRLEGKSGTIGWLRRNSIGHPAHGVQGIEGGRVLRRQRVHDGTTRYGASLHPSRASDDTARQRVASFKFLNKHVIPPFFPHTASARLVSSRLPLEIGSHRINYISTLAAADSGR